MDSDLILEVTEEELEEFPDPTSIEWRKHQHRIRKTSEGSCVSGSTSELSQISTTLPTVNLVNIDSISRQIDCLQVSEDPEDQVDSHLQLSHRKDNSFHRKHLVSYHPKRLQRRYKKFRQHTVRKNSVSKNRELLNIVEAFCAAFRHNTISPA